MEIQLWREILSPYEQAVTELVEKIPTSEPGTQGTGIVFSHRTGHRTCKKHYQYSGKNETKEHSV